jgi:hypothetical protein
MAQRPDDTAARQAADLLQRVRAGEAALPAEAVQPLVRAYLDLLDALDGAPRPAEVDGFLDPRSPYSGWYREIRASRLERSGPARAVDPQAVEPEGSDHEALERKQEADRQAARALIAAFERPRPTAWR